MKTKNIFRFLNVLAALVLVLPGLSARAEELNLSFDFGNLPAEKPAKTVA